MKIEDDEQWVGFCQKRRHWIKNETSEEINFGIPLIHAIMDHGGHPKVVKLLLDKGADLNTAPSGYEGYDALWHIREFKNPKIMKVVENYISIPPLTIDEFNDCDKSSNDVATCSISQNELEPWNTVKPPNSNYCFEHSSLMIWLQRNRTNPVTRSVILENWIDTYYPLGLEYDYSNLLDKRKESTPDFKGGVRKRKSRKKNNRKMKKGYKTRRRRSIRKCR